MLVSLSVTMETNLVSTIFFVFVFQWQFSLKIVCSCCKTRCALLLKVVDGGFLMLQEHSTL